MSSYFTWVFCIATVKFLSLTQLAVKLSNICATLWGKTKFLWARKVSWLYCCYQVHFWELNQHEVPKALLLWVQGASNPFILSLVMLQRPPVLCHTLKAEYQCKLRGNLRFGGAFEWVTAVAWNSSLKQGACSSCLWFVSYPNSSLAWQNVLVTKKKKIYVFNEGETWQPCPRKALPGVVNHFSDGLMQLMISCFFPDSNLLCVKYIAPYIKKICSVLWRQHIVLHQPKTVLTQQVWFPEHD